MLENTVLDAIDRRYEREAYELAEYKEEIRRYIELVTPARGTVYCYTGEFIPADSQYPSICHICGSQHGCEQYIVEIRDAHGNLCNNVVACNVCNDYVATGKLPESMEYWR